MAEPALEEDRAIGEPLGSEEVAPRQGIAVSVAEATGPDPTESDVSITTGGAERSAESLTISADEAEEPDGARQPRRRTVPVLVGSGLLILVVVGSLSAWRERLPVALGSVLSELSTSADVLLLIAPPFGAAEPDAESVSEALPPGSTTADVDPWVMGLETETESVAEGGRDSEAATATNPVGESLLVISTATIDTPGFTGVNLRAAPSTSAAAIQVVPAGTRVDLLEGQVDNDGLGWTQIRVPTGETGWVVSGTIQH